MTANTLILAIVVIFSAILIFSKWAESQDKFEDNAAKQEYLKTWLAGFKDGLNDTGRNNAAFTDDILKRLGYTQVEQIEAMRTVAETPILEEEIPPVILPHEVEFDLEEADRKVENAGWVDGNLLIDSQENTQTPFDQDVPPM